MSLFADNQTHDRDVMLGTTGWAVLKVSKLNTSPILQAAFQSLAMP
jgi:hypothetical protein